MMEDNTELTVANETDEERLSRLAAEINTIKAQTMAVVQNATLEIGKRLVQAKAAVGHGNWGSWLARNVDYKERTAQSIIAIYERFGTGQQKLFGREADPEQVAKLNRSQMAALMSIKDEDACFWFMEEHREDLQDMSKRELEAAIKELNTLKEEHDSLKAENDGLKADREEREHLLREAKVQIDCQKERYELEIENLNRQLDEAEDTPELKELETLKARIHQLEAARLEKSREEKRFAHHFENVRTELEGMLQELGRIDADKQIKYREIASGLLQAVLGQVKGQN